MTKSSTSFARYAEVDPAPANKGEKTYLRAEALTCFSSHATAALSAFSLPSTRSSGPPAPPLTLPVRSTIVATDKCRMSPLLSEKGAFAVEAPNVGWPKLRVLGRPRKAMVVASPELQVILPVKTATNGFGAFRR